MSKYSAKKIPARRIDAVKPITGRNEAEFIAKLKELVDAAIAKKSA